jgi:TrmH family RNA methyltransferase
MTLATSTIKYIRSLHQKKFRQNYNKFIVEGDKLARECLGQEYFPIEGLFATREWLAAYGSKIPLASGQIQEVSPAALGRISQLTTPNEVLLVVEQKNRDIPAGFPGNKQALFLDRIADPGNFGTILRIADWFGIGPVFYSPDCVEPYNPKVVQASMGSIFRVPFVEIGLDALKSTYPQLHVVGTDMKGESVYDFQPPASSVIVIGSEHHGIRDTYRTLLDGIISIPGEPSSRSESLNAAVAAGIVCAFLHSAKERHI